MIDFNKPLQLVRTLLPSMTPINAYLVRIVDNGSIAIIYCNKLNITYLFFTELQILQMVADFGCLIDVSFTLENK